jgi:hypothetical protein
MMAIATQYVIDHPQDAQPFAWRAWARLWTLESKDARTNFASMMLDQYADIQAAKDRELPRHLVSGLYSLTSELLRIRMLET